MDVPLVRHPPSVVLVPVDADLLVCVRQTRRGAPDPTLELPSGKLESGEAPVDAAARELAEECGLRAAELREVGRFWVVPAYSTELAHVFAATGLSPSPLTPRDPDEDIEVVRIPLGTARTRLEDAASLAAFSLWEDRRSAAGDRSTN